MPHMKGWSRDVAGFSVIILTGARPRSVARLIARLQADAPDITIGGILYERRRPKPFARRMRDFIGQLRDPVFRGYAAARIWAAVADRLSTAGHSLLRLAHAAPSNPNGRLDYGLDDLCGDVAASNIQLLCSHEIHAAASLDFVRRAQPQLGVVFGTRILKPELYDIPVHGSINVHQRKVPDYRGGGPIGLWELLDDCRELGVTVHRVAAAVDAGAVVATATIPIHPFDTLASLELKADVIGLDLMVAAIRDFAAGTVAAAPQMGTGKTFTTPSPQNLRRLVARIESVRPPYRAKRGRPTVKLLARSVLLAPYLVVRNHVR